MSARRVTVDTRLEEPANPTYIDFPRGDGQPITWPTNTTRIVDSEGQVNFFDPLPLSHNQSIRWRALVASAIANDLQMAGAFLFCKLADTHMKLSFVSLQRGHRIFWEIFLKDMVFLITIKGVKVILDMTYIYMVCFLIDLPSPHLTTKRARQETFSLGQWIYTACYLADERPCDTYLCLQILQQKQKPEGNHRVDEWHITFLASYCIPDTK